jgi:hypothetical protein
MHRRYWILEPSGGFVALSSNRPIFLLQLREIAKHALRVAVRMPVHLCDPVRIVLFVPGRLVGRI